MKRTNRQFKGLKIKLKEKEMTKLTKLQQLLFKCKISNYRRMEIWERLKYLATVLHKKHFLTHQLKKIPNNYHKNFKTIRKHK